MPLLRRSPAAFVSLASLVTALSFGWTFSKRARPEVGENMGSSTQEFSQLPERRVDSDLGLGRSPPSGALPYNEHRIVTNPKTGKQHLEPVGPQNPKTP